MDKLEKYYDKVVNLRCHLKERQAIKEIRLPVKVNVPGSDFVVKKQCKTFEEGWNYRQMKRRTKNDRRLLNGTLSRRTHNQPAHVPSPNNHPIPHLR
jgi:hypothetical protein